jgi:hypothetical protein
MEGPKKPSRLLDLVESVDKYVEFSGISIGNGKLISLLR